MTRQEKISRIIEIQTLLTSLIIKNRGDDTFQPHTGDEYQPLREEVQRLREEVFGKPEKKDNIKRIKKKIKKDDESKKKLSRKNNLLSKQKKSKTEKENIDFGPSLLA